MAERLGTGLTMAGFFLDPIIMGVAARCERPASTERVVDTVPMAATLRRLWWRHHERADPGVYDVAHRVDLHGDLDPGILAGALEDLVGRHHAPRSRAVRRDDGQHDVEVPAEAPECDAGPCGEPSGDGGHGAVRQQAEGSAGLDVDQDRAVDASLPQGEVINS
ncbi:MULTISPECIES: hypothetical protein [Streptomyces]|uniref:Uncharacterized protein n=1 Tax=Streptomyces fradiae TaxID=1906 RepID=A0ACC4WH05_STRFR|nr:MULTISPECIES: hypothetical protein [Streptomyces]KNE83896.1 hypothetical protein ADZ36_02895 [Streptomyces fradiae]OFA55774.1 hypothetical protein BEN35_07525 [Streptomyces fradiae]